MIQSFVIGFQETARDILKKAPGVVVIDSRESNHFPTPLEVSNKDDVAVGRIRRDVSSDGNYGYNFYILGHYLLPLLYNYLLWITSG